VKRAEVDALVAPLTNLATPTPRGILTPGSTWRDKKKLVVPPKRKKLPRFWVEADQDVVEALAIIRAARKAQHPGIANEFLTRSALIREALLSVADQLTND
jgi:hypothetical protein